MEKTSDSHARFINNRNNPIGKNKTEIFTDLPTKNRRMVRPLNYEEKCKNF